MSAEAAETIAAPPGTIDEEHLIRSVIRLAWPVVVQQVSFSMVQLVDTALVGHLGEDSLAGVRLAGQIFWFSQAGMMALAVGSTAVIARNVAEPEARHQGTVYLKAAAVGMPFWSLTYAGSASLQGAGDTRTPMAIGVLVNATNIVIAYTLINGRGPFPRLDVLGSGAGFSGAAIIGGSLVLTVLASGTRIIHWYPWEALRFDRVEAGRVLNVGVPAGLEQIQFNIAFMTYTRIIATLGTTALAAHGVTLAIQSLTFNVGFGLSVATTALVGQSLGAHRPDLAERSTYVTMRYSLAFMVALGAVLMIFGGQITDLFVGGKNADEVVHIGRQLLFVFAFAMPALAVSLCLGGGLRGAGDTRAVLLIMAGTTWIVRLIPAYLLAITFGLGVPGAWVAAVLDINSRAVLMFLRFRQGRWKEIKV